MVRAGAQGGAGRGAKGGGRGAGRGAKAGGAGRGGRGAAKGAAGRGGRGAAKGAAGGGAGRGAKGKGAAGGAAGGGKKGAASKGKNAGKKGSGKSSSASAVSTMVSIVSERALKKFIAAELRSNPDALRRFVDVARAERRAKLKTDYRAVVASMFERAAGEKGYLTHYSRLLNFKGPMKDARDSERIRDYAEAARIYEEVYDGIISNVKLMYDEQWRAYSQAGLCIYRMGRCAAAAATTAADAPDEHRKILADMVRMLARSGITLQSEFEYSIAEGIVDRGDIKYIDGLAGSGRDGVDLDIPEMAILKRALSMARKNLAGGGGSGRRREKR